MWSNQRESLVKGFRFYVRCRTTNIMLGTQASNPQIHATYIASKAPTPEQTAEETEAVALAFESKKAALDLTGRETDEEEQALQMTVFPRAMFFVADNGRIYDPKTDVWPADLSGEYQIIPFIWDYQFRGSFKESITMLTKAAGGRAAAKENGSKYASAQISNHKKVVDGNWFIITRKIPLYIPETFIDDVGEEITTYDAYGNLRTLQRPLRCETAKGPRTALATSEIVPEGTEFFFGINLLNPSDLKACLETLDYKEEMGMLQWRGGGKGTLIWTLCNEFGVPYEDLNPSELTEQDKLIIARVNKAVPGCVQVNCELPEIKDEVAGEKTTKKRGKKSEDVDAEGSAEESGDEPAKKPRKRRTKEEIEADKQAKAERAAARAAKKAEKAAKE